MNKHEVIEKIVLERARLLDLVNQLGADADKRVVTDEGWTAKDVLAHCIHWVGQVAFGVGAPVHPPAWVEAAGNEKVEGEEWNRRVVEHYKAMPLDIVRRDFEQVVEATLDKLRRRDDIDYDVRANAVFPWVKSDVPVWKVIAGETWEHWPEHSESLERARRDRAVGRARPASKRTT
jgi:hypothetical protein